MSVALWIAGGGLAVMALGWLAAMALPKVPPENEGQPGAWITPDDYSVQPWTAAMFGIGFGIALLGLATMGIHDGHPGWPESVIFTWLVNGLTALVAWCLLLRWLWRRSHEEDEKAERILRGERDE